MKTSVVLCSVLGILVIATTAVAGYRGLEHHLWSDDAADTDPVRLPPSRLIEPLDVAVQSRFAYFDFIQGDFGMSRIIQESQVRGHGKLVPPPSRVESGPRRGTWALRRTRDGNMERIRVLKDYDPVRDLQKAGWDTALAVATRVPPKSPTLLDRILRRKQALRLARDPVLLTERKGGIPPSAAPVFEVSTDLMARATEHGTASVRVEDWSFLARPVMAHSQECIRCHSRGLDGKPLLVGQPLAIAVYGFKRHSPSRAEPSAAQMTQVHAAGR